MMNLYHTKLCHYLDLAEILVTFEILGGAAIYFQSDLAA